MSLGRRPPLAVLKKKRDPEAEEHWGLAKTAHIDPILSSDEVLKDEIENQSSKRLKIETRKGKSQSCP